MTPDERAEAVVTTQIDKWEATHESLRFGQLPRMDLVEAVAAQIREAVKEERTRTSNAIDWVRENESCDGGYICDRLDERLRVRDKEQ